MSLLPFLIWSLYHVLALSTSLLLAVFLFPFLRVSSFLSISFFFLSFFSPVFLCRHFLFILFSWCFLGYLLSSFTTYQVTQTHLAHNVFYFHQDHKLFKTRKPSSVTSTILCFRVLINALQIFKWVMTLVLRVYGEFCRIHPQQNWPN